MPRARVTERDPNLPHQIILAQSQARSATHITVSCNCRRVKKHTTWVYEPFAEIASSEDPWLYYNNPLNHSSHTGPFNPNATTHKEVWVK